MNSKIVEWTKLYLTAQESGPGLGKLHAEQGAANIHSIFIEGKTPFVCCYAYVSDKWGYIPQWYLRSDGKFEGLKCIFTSDSRKKWFEVGVPNVCTGVNVVKIMEGRKSVLCEIIV